MERVHEIRAEIARNAALTKNKMFLDELRRVSRLFAYFDVADEEALDRLGLIRIAVKDGNAQRIHRLLTTCNRASDAREWDAEIAPAQRKGGVR